MASEPWSCCEDVELARALCRRAATSQVYTTELACAVSAPPVAVVFCRLGDCHWVAVTTVFTELARMASVPWSCRVRTWSLLVRYVAGLPRPDVELARALCRRVATSQVYWPFIFAASAPPSTLSRCFTSRVVLL